MAKTTIVCKQLLSKVQLKKAGVEKLWVGFKQKIKGQRSFSTSICASNNENFQQQQLSQQQQSSPSPILQYRRQLEKQFTKEVFQVVGVTFNSVRVPSMNRQDIIGRLRVGMRVQLVREPNNEFDPHAVSVRNMEDVDVGYISKDQTYHFKHHQSFGVVESVGQAGDSSLGLKIATVPQIQFANLEPLPQYLVQWQDIQKYQQGNKEWTTFYEQICQAQNFSCAITSTPFPQDSSADFTRAIPIYEIDDENSVIKLDYLSVVMKEIADLFFTKLGSSKEGINLEMPSDRHIFLLSRINGWDTFSTCLYLKCRRDRWYWRTAKLQSYSLDLSYLERHQLSIPVDLKKLVVDDMFSSVPF